MQLLVRLVILAGLRLQPILDVALLVVRNTYERSIIDFTRYRLAMTSVKTLNVLSIVIGIIALSTCIGFSFKHQALYVVGQASGFSPMPLPFRELASGAENINVDFYLTVQDATGTNDISQEQVIEMFDLHSRPHRAVIPFYTIAAYFAAVPYPIKYQAFMYVCKKLNAEELTAHALYAGQKNHFHVVCTI